MIRSLSRDNALLTGEVDLAGRPRMPDAIALVDGTTGERVSYRQLEEQVDARARGCASVACAGVTGSAH